LLLLALLLLLLLAQAMAGLSKLLQHLQRLLLPCTIPGSMYSRTTITAATTAHRWSGHSWHSIRQNSLALRPALCLY
jgi:hypothetical protein